MYQIIVSGYSNPDNVNERVIFAIIADGLIVKAYADEVLANIDYQRLRQFSKPGSKISKPIAVKFADNQAIDSRGRFGRVMTG
jgi:hypothetical protein